LLECLSVRKQLNNHSGIAATLDSLASVAHGTGDTTRAVRLAAGSAALRLAYKTPLAPSERTAVKKDMEVFRNALSEQDFESAWAFGSALSLDRLVTYAREARLLPNREGGVWR
jgi:hypothetical protein